MRAVTMTTTLSFVVWTTLAVTATTTLAFPACAAAAAFQNFDSTAVVSDRHARWRRRERRSVSVIGQQRHKQAASFESLFGCLNKDGGRGGIYVGTRSRIDGGIPTRLWSTAAAAASVDVASSLGSQVAGVEEASHSLSNASTIQSPVVIQEDPKRNMSKLKALVTKVGMMSFITAMCVALPLSLIPVAILHKLRIIDTPRKESLSLQTGQFCARWLLRLIPFCHVDVLADGNDNDAEQEEPSVWVCNHISMIDFFVLMSAKHKLVKRPIKVVYWKGLESNPISKILFRMCGFIPVSMADNGNGTANDYDKSSFRDMIRQSKRAFREGFDLGILPEGQLNPTPEGGLLPVFGGAYTLAKMSKRPIRFLALRGTQHLWHPIRGMDVTDNRVAIRLYPKGKRQFANSDEFTNAFRAVVGHFGATGQDLPPEEMQKWMGEEVATATATAS